MIEVPFFIVGFQRSGTTLLRLMLDNHPDVAIPLDTTGLWNQFEGRLPEYGDLTAASNRRHLIEDLVREERIRLWEIPLDPDKIEQKWNGAGYSGLIDAFYRIYAEARGKARWGDKDPGNMVRISQLDRWFPESQFIHIIRDGRDACLSQLQQSFGFDDLLPCAAAWKEQVWWVREMGKLLGEQRYFELRYEDLVAQPQQHLLAICQFLDIPYSPVMLQYHEKVDQSVPQSKRHLWPLLNQPPRQDNTDQWKRKMKAAQQLCFEKRAGDVLREVGYETRFPNPSGGYLEEVMSMARRARKGILGRIKKRRPGN